MVRVMGQWSRVSDQGLRPRIRGNGYGSRITGQDSQESVIKGYRSRVMIRGHWSEVKYHWSKVTGQRSLIKVHWSVKGQWSKVTGQWSVVKGHDQGSICLEALARLSG